MSLAIAGERSSGEDVRNQNVTACMSVANVVRSSLGPLGLDKMLVDDIGDVVITNDGATILKRLDLEHPCAKVLVELANLQDKEVGDGTTSVVILAAQLLKRANELISQGIHPTSIITGYQIARKQACNFIAKNMSLKVSELGDDALQNAAKTSMSSKIIGKDSDFFADLAVRAMKAVETTNSLGKKRYPVKAVEILKIAGQGTGTSELVNGYALEMTRASQQMPRRIENAKIALVDFDFRKMALKFGIQMIIEDPTKLEEMRKREATAIQDKIDMLMKAGANVFLTTKGIDDMAKKYFVDKGCIAIGRIEKKKLRRIATLTGGKMLISLADDDCGDSVPEGCLGEASVVEERNIGDRDVIFIKECKSTAAQTILLRGANWYMLEEIERSMHDTLCIIKRTLESGHVVPGGGAVEAAVSVFLDSFAESMSSREQLAVGEYAQSLLIIPKTLAINGGYDASDLVSKLKGYHVSSQTSDDEKLKKRKWLGLDLEEGKIRDRIKAGVMEPAMSKIKSFKFATEAAVTILRIDDAITLQRKENPRDAQGHE